MGRRLFTFVSVLSLLLCIAVCVLWGRSHWRYDVLLRGLPNGSGLDAVSSGASSVVLERNWGLPPGSLTDAPRWVWESKPNDPAARWDSYVDQSAMRWRLARFLWASQDPPAGAYSMRLLVVPYWALAALTALLPAYCLHRFRRDRLARARHEAGRCSACGYDLRATSGRCPECGRAPATTAAA